MPPWIGAVISALVALIFGALSAYVTTMVLLARHDERLKVMKEEVDRLRKHYHDLREDLRKLLVDYFQHNGGKK